MVENMKNRHILKNVTQRSCVIAGIVALVAIVGMAGSYYYRNSKNGADTQQEQQASVGDEEQTGNVASDAELEDYGTENGQDGAAEAMTQQTADPSTSSKAASGQSIQGNVDETARGQNAGVDADSSGDVVETSGTQAAALNFTDTSEADWPVRGDVLLPYSMDKTVYFATLDQYKYNPAMIIAASVNMKVTAAADEKITDISTNADTGLTVTADLGNGYAITYGQLKEVELNVGDVVSRGEVIGYVSEPTKYYCVEGTNLYLAMTKDGTPVNPMDFLQ